MTEQERSTEQPQDGDELALEAETLKDLESTDEEADAVRGGKPPTGTNQPGEIC